MRWFAATFAIVLAIGVRLSTAQSENGQTLVPFIELQSDALTPPVVVEESPRPVTPAVLAEKVPRITRAAAG